MITSSRRAGFSLIELLIIIGIAGLLLALLLPALAASRESARGTACKNNLRQFGLGLNVYADSHRGFLCSGAFDWKRDGVPTETGWVADMVDRGVVPGQMLCPTNECQISEIFNDLVGASSSTADFSCGVNHSGSMPHSFPDGAQAINPCRIILGTFTGSWTAPWGTTYMGGSPLAPASEDRRKLVEELVLQRGYNTNYAASWWLVRSGARLDRNGNLVQMMGFNDLGSPCPTASNRERSSTLGPIHRRLLDNAAAPSSNIPLMGDAAPADPTAPPLVASIGPHSTGSRVCRSFGAGPVQNLTMSAPIFPAGTPKTGPSGWVLSWAGQTRQDYRSFAPLHGAFRAGHANMLMADGSVRSFVDENKDGFLNNGFDPTAYSGTQDIGFRENNTELTSEEIFNGYSLKRADQLTLNQ